MTTVKMFFNVEDAILYAKKVLDVDLSNIKNAFEGFDYIPQSVFEYAMDFHDFHMMRRGLVWYTQNDVLLSGSKIPNLWVNNVRVPATASLVIIVDGDSSYVNYTNVYDTTGEIFKMSNRQFQLNSQQL